MFFCNLVPGVLRSSEGPGGIQERTTVARNRHGSLQDFNNGNKSEREGRYLLRWEYQRYGTTCTFTATLFYKQYAVIGIFVLYTITR